MSYAYLDWNVINKIEKIATLPPTEAKVLQLIEQHILDSKITVPYSNAHISDLHRGYIKNPSFTPAHLATIRRLTHDLCIVQYWGEKDVRWHYRDPEEFLRSTTEDSDRMTTSFAELMNFDDDPTISALNNIRNTLLSLQPVPAAFKQIYAADPIFNLMYPRTKASMNMLALCEDIYDFSNKIKEDYTLYKHYRKYLTQCKLKYQQLRKAISEAEKAFLSNPAYLTWDGMWDEVIANTHQTTTSNVTYDKMFSLFTTTDLRGYRQDERFANLIDDALHTFYAAHCDYFLTLDSRCYDKAKRVYDKLKIATKVFTPEEFVLYITKE